MTTNKTRRGIGAACALAALAALLGVTGSGSALAQNAGDASPAAPLASEVGHSTRGWLDLQRSGAQAAPPLTMLGEEAGLAYQRYMESFKAKIPVSFGSSVGENGNLLRVDYLNSSGAQQN